MARMRGFFAAPVADTRKLIVPMISVLEVYKRVLQPRGDDAALQAVAHMMQGQAVVLDAGIAIAAGRLDVAHKLPLADSVMLATVRRHAAILWTQDADCEGLEGVRYVSCKR